MLRFVSQVSQILSEKPSRSGRKTRCSLSLEYQNLEPRNLLASISFDPGTGIVSMVGDGANDVGVVSVDSPTTTLVALSGLSETYLTADIASISFFGIEGNDFFRNDTNIASTAFGGNGDDILIGGSNNDGLFAGFGNDTLVGNDGNDRLHGLAGNDHIDGGEGDDQLVGYDGIDLLIGGGGNDLLLGLGGRDTLQGDGGNDEIYGGADADSLTGGLGNDIMVGGDGDDTLTGLDGNDLMFGNGGVDSMAGGNDSDRLYGGTENDILEGNAGDDFLFGEDGDDTLEGNAGNDRMFGGMGNDDLRGGVGLDFLAGEDGDDMIFGDADADEIYGNNGDDMIYGGAANDTIYAGFGMDMVRGGDGIDLIYGNSDNDELHGDDGNDQLYGGGGNDDLYGGQGEDILRGEEGNDGLSGGADNNNILLGGADNDRFLYFEGDSLGDLNVDDDARIEFRNLSSNWTQKEIEVVDQGLALLHDRTGNTRLLKGTLTDRPLVFNKEFTLPISSPPSDVRIATNELVSITEQVYNPDTDTVETIEFMERQHSFGDWDETDTALNDRYTAEIPREIAHNWASSEAITAVLPSQGSYWFSYLLLSGWTQTRPDDIQFFDVSLDDEWYFRLDALFVEDFSTTNPVEDFASVWKLYFDPDAAAEKDRLVTKISQVDDLFTMLEIF